MAKKSKENKKSKKKGGVSVDFSGVKSFKAIPEGSYIVECTAVEEATSGNDNPMLKFEFEVAEGKNKGAKLWFNAMLLKQSLFRLRELLEAMGQEVPDGEMDIDTDELVGQKVGVVVVHEDYEGDPRAKISDFLAADEVDSEEESDDEDEEDDKPAKGKSAKKGKKSSKEEDDEEEEVDVASLDEDELAELVEEKGLDVDLDKYSSIKKKRAAVEKALESSDDDEEEDDDSDDEETYTEDQIDEMDEEELQKLNDDLELDIDDLEDMKPKKAKAAVIKALKKKKLLAD